MNYFIGTLYGVLQGVTEFLPVSSSGHLALLPHFLHFKDPGLAFDLAMHLGTALAIIFYFYKDILRYSIAAVAVIKKPAFYKNHAFIVNFTLSTCATVIFALLFKNYAEVYGRNSWLIAFNLAFFGVLMMLADKFFPQDESIKMEQKIYVKKSLLIGLFQVIALFPGVSRSGITLTMARYCQLSRMEGTKFSFLLSVPLILGGFVMKLPQMINSNTEAFDLPLLCSSMFVAFAVGLLTIHFFLKFIARVGLFSFGIYRLLLAGVIVYFQLLQGT